MFSSISPPAASVLALDKRNTKTKIMEEFKMSAKFRNYDKSDYTASGVKTGFEYTKSDYALNKKRKQGIAYRPAVGRVIEVAHEDCLWDNPEYTHDDFAEIKGISNSIYHEQDRANQRQTRLNVPLDSNEYILKYYVSPSLEDEYIERTEQEESLARRRSLAKQALGLLSEAQLRRYLLHTAHALSTRKIAELEGVSQRTVMDSLEWAKKKVESFIESCKIDLSK